MLPAKAPRQNHLLAAQHYSQLIARTSAPSQNQTQLSWLGLWSQHLFLSRSNQVRWRILACVEKDMHREHSWGCEVEKNYLQCLQEGVQSYDWDVGVEVAVGFIAGNCTGPKDFWKWAAWNWIWKFNRSVIVSEDVRNHERMARQSRSLWRAETRLY